MTRVNMIFKYIGLSSAFILVSACGFTPLYKTDNNTPDIHKELSKIYINSIPEKQGVVLYNQLIDHLNKYGIPKNPKYRLVSSIDTKILKTAIKRNNESKRGVIRVSGTFELITSDTTKIFYSRSECGYTVVKNPYASDTAEQDATIRCLRDIASDAYGQLSLYFRDQMTSKKGK